MIIYCFTHFVQCMIMFIFVTGVFMNQEEKNKNHYRLDILKFKQKVMNLFPIGSVERKKLVKEAKLEELEKLRGLSSIISSDTHKILLRAGIINVLFCITKSIFGIIGFALCRSVSKQCKMGDINIH